MHISIKPLAPELLNDYLWFFDNRAFCTHPDWAACYCTFYTLKGPLADYERRTAQLNRSEAEQQIMAGDLKGFLAYNDKVPVGFCNVNAKEKLYFDKYRTEISSTGTDGIVSVVCFVIDHKYRRKGISRALLSAAINHYSNSDYGVMESYPSKNTSEESANYHGYSALYTQNGFSVLESFKDYEIMRLELK